MRPAPGTVIPVPVLQAHIDAGKPGFACDCALALAVTDAMPEAFSASVMYADAPEFAEARAWISRSAWLRLVLGETGRHLMSRFDNGLPVEPITLMAKVA